MRLTILGMYGPFPAPGGACSGYLLEARGARVLLDCGPGVLSRLMAHAAPDQLDAVVLSHLHYDHVSDLWAMGYALDFSGRKDKLPLYLPPEPAPVRTLLHGGAFEAREIRPMQIGPLSFDFLPAAHSVPGFSVKARCDGKSILYTGDTNWHAELPAFARGCDLIVADAALTQAMWSDASPHMSGALCARLAREAGAGQLILSHLRPDADWAQVLREAGALFPDARLARAEMALDV